MRNHHVEEPRAGPSILEDLLERSQAFLREMIADRIKDALHRAFERALGRLVIHLVAAALFITAAVFGLVAGTEGLKLAGAPTWAAYLSLGLLGALIGGLLMREPDDRHDRRGRC